MTALDLIKCLKKIKSQKLLLTCAPISELPSNISIIVLELHINPGNRLKLEGYCCNEQHVQKNIQFVPNLLKEGGTELWQESK
mgnify:CR=1 FL=1